VEGLAGVDYAVGVRPARTLQDPGRSQSVEFPVKPAKQSISVVSGKQRTLRANDLGRSGGWAFTSMRSNEYGDPEL